MNALNGNLFKTVVGGSCVVLVSYSIGFGIYIVAQLANIKDAAADIKQDVAILKYKVDAYEISSKTRTEDRYTGRDATRDRAEYEKRFQALEKKKQ